MVEAALSPGRRGRRLLVVWVLLVALEIADAGRLHRFERDATGTWFYHGVHGGDRDRAHPRRRPALAASIERAVDALGRARVERNFPLGATERRLRRHRPEVVVLVYRAGSRNRSRSTPSVTSLPTR